MTTGSDRTPRHRGINPLGGPVDSKYWPSVNRIDNVYGDRNLFCACPAIENYEEV